MIRGASQDGSSEYPAFDLRRWDGEDPNAPAHALEAEVKRVLTLEVGAIALAQRRRYVEELYPNTQIPIERRTMHCLEDEADVIAARLRQTKGSSANVPDWKKLSQIAHVDAGESLEALLTAHAYRVFCMNAIYRAGRYGFTLNETVRRMGLVESGRISESMFGAENLDDLLALQDHYNEHGAE